MLNIKKQSLDDLTVQSDNLYNDNANNIISIDADKLIEREQDFKIRDERVIELMNSLVLLLLQLKRQDIMIYLQVVTVRELVRN